jgi:uncharacterized lipoprotein YddW (UPF0748 family)
VQEPPVLANREDIDSLIKFAKTSRVKMLFVQIYRSNQAWFPSRIADSSPYEACRKNVGEDPFKYLIKKAHAAGIEVHAWLNMLSLGDNKDAIILKKYGPEILTKNRKEKKVIEDYRIDEQYFLEPGDMHVRNDLSCIVGEILRLYPDMDGIQFDYLRYPDEHPDYGYTRANLFRFRRATGARMIGAGNRAWKEWKRAQVTALLELLIKKIRSVDPKMQISATGCMPYSRAYHEAFQDWPSWLNDRRVDFVTVMSYSPYADEFAKWISEIKDKVSDFKKVYIGVGAYKLVKSPKIFDSELSICEKSGAGGCVVFHYGSLVRKAGLRNILKKHWSYDILYVTKIGRHKMLKALIIISIVWVGFFLLAGWRKKNGKKNKPTFRTEEDLDEYGKPMKDDHQSTVDFEDAE